MTASSTTAASASAGTSAIAIDGAGGNDNPLNLYAGPDAVRAYFDPDRAPPLPLVEVPDGLNPYRARRVRVFAKMMTMHPANNVKAMPALNLLEQGVAPGRTRTVVESSSGSTVISMSMVARVYYGIDDVRAYLSNKTSATKLRLMQFFGLDVTVFGGPAQPEPRDERGMIQLARRLAEEEDGVFNPNQYENEDNWKSHTRWTGPQIHKQLPDVNVVCAGMGTSGTITGLGTYFNKAKPDVFSLGVCTAAGERVPGPRVLSLIQPVEFPWKAAVDHIEEVGAYDSYATSLDLTRQGIVCGPSSGFNLKGLYQFLDKRIAAGTLDDLAGPDGEIKCVFLCCDLPYQYIGEYFDNLGDDKFPSIKNENLLKVDRYPYVAAWEKTPDEALATFFSFSSFSSSSSSPHEPDTLPASSNIMAALAPRPGTTVVDLRQPADFAAAHLPGAANIELRALKAGAGTGSPFYDPELLACVWRELDHVFGDARAAQFRGRRVLLACYDGDSARVASSVLRHRGVAADSVRGGMQGILRALMRRAGDEENPEASEDSHGECSGHE